ncbi:hypothetical protein HDIA_2246 [Hartmannibacter diazotrophicus]|uniref:Uncharacterized protein n=1 Tax=Hartmannibacter diazotrophicus TaxID=1482074 RepID=A0A2C9D652_9HYPH|nr:hypothetical protein [Hartmannibacter diazotrophicus]SON55787.1 hypothetical protein HDIA_2246 [Hartmannibacter diazotrophicus]
MATDQNGGIGELDGKAVERNAELMREIDAIVARQGGMAHADQLYLMIGTLAAGIADIASKRPGDTAANAERIRQAATVLLISLVDGHVEAREERGAVVQ